GAGHPLIPVASCTTSRVLEQEVPQKPIPASGIQGPGPLARPGQALLVPVPARPGTFWRKTIMHNVFTARTHAWLNRPAAAAGRTLAASDGGGGQLFIASAVEYPDGTATFPLYRGTSHGQNVYYLVLDTSDGNLSQALGVNRSQKLANARNTAAAQKVNVINGVVDFPA